MIHNTTTKLPITLDMENIILPIYWQLDTQEKEKTENLGSNNCHRSLKGKKHWLFDLKTLYRGAFCQFPFQWIYYCHIGKYIGKETHLCVMWYTVVSSVWLKFTQWLEYRIVVSFFVKRSQYIIRIETPLHEQFEKAYMCF